MATGARNRSRYSKSKSNGQSLDNPESCTPDFLEQLWIARRRRDPIKDGYELSDESSSLNGEATASALKLLWDATGDEAFRTSLLALPSYGLERGGLKEQLKRQMRGPHDVRPAIALALPTMYLWRRKVKTDIQAARLTAAQHGIPGASFDAVVKQLIQAFPSWKCSAETEKAAPAYLTGDTGRKLKVRMAHPWLGPDNLPAREIRGVTFDADGGAIAPDDAWWRRMIRCGHFCLCGVIDHGEEAGNSFQT
jgi:hypothetical protein